MFSRSNVHNIELQHIHFVCLFGGVVIIINAVEFDNN